DYSKEINMSSSLSEKSNDSKLWPLTTINNPSICTIDDQDMNSNDIEQKLKEKKRQNKNKRTTIHTDLLIDVYCLTQRADRESFDSFECLSEDEDLLLDCFFAKDSNQMN
ncbi:unnamed protein product, partial [Rotaria sp. Silwood2]